MRLAEARNRARRGEGRGQDAAERDLRLPAKAFQGCARRAAASATLERFSGQSEIPFRGILPATLTTPGAVASFGEAHARLGRLPLARCLADAIAYARE